MDTKGVLEANWKRLKNARDCGKKIFAITNTGAFTIDTTCKNWDCLKCIKVKISIIQELLNENINGPHVFISQIEYRGKQLSKWIQKNKPEEVSTFFYFAFQTVKGTILISSHRFPDHPPIRRMSKRGYVDKDLPEFIMEHHREVKRISHSRGSGIHNNKQKFVLATSFDEKLAEEAKTLRTDRERAEFLFSNRDRAKLNKLGKKLIREHLGNQAL